MAVQTLKSTKLYTWDEYDMQIISVKLLGKKREIQSPKS